MYGTDLTRFDISCSDTEKATVSKLIGLYFFQSMINIQTQFFPLLLLCVERPFFTKDFKRRACIQCVFFFM